MRALIWIAILWFGVLTLATSATLPVTGHGRFTLESDQEKGLATVEPLLPRNYVLFESGPVRPLAITPDGRQLLVTNIPDARLEIFAITEVGLIQTASVAVGLEPVAVAVTPDGHQAWVVNHLSDSISVVDLEREKPMVTRTLWVGDEPRDIVFAGPGRAFITTAHRGQNSPVIPALTSHGIGRADVWVFDAQNPGPGGGQPLSVLTLFGDTPRALAVSADGSRVYAAIFRSGNGTTTLPPPPAPFNKAEPTDSADGVIQPNTGLIVRNQGFQWLDELGQDFGFRVGFQLPDLDVFEINANANPPVEIRSFAHVGTTLYNLAVNPVSGNLYVSNTEARNDVRFAGEANRATTSVQGHLADHRVTVINNGQVLARDLNTHLDFSGPGTPQENQASLSQPMQMVVSQDGNILYLAAFGSGKIARLDIAALEQGSLAANPDDHLELSGGGPSGLALTPDGTRLFVYTRFDNGVSVVDPATFSESDHVLLHNPEPEHIIAGRPFLYDARKSSSRGNEACSTCHLFGNVDALAWDLGDPDGSVQAIPNAYSTVTINNPGLNFTFHPMKGPMATQSMRGLPRHGPIHWRGDRTGKNRGPDETLEEAAFKEFNEAFMGLMDKAAPLSDEDMDTFTRFSLELTYPPNPIRALDNQLNDQETMGLFLFNSGVRRSNGALEICRPCHTIDQSNGIFGTTGLMSFNDQPGETDFKIPHFRDQYQKIGSFSPAFSDPGVSGPQIRGFGFNHNGATHTTNVLDGLGLPASELGALRAFLFAFPTDQAPIVGQQVTLDAAGDADSNQRIDLMVQRAAVTQPIGECDLVVTGQVAGQPRSWLRDDAGQFVSDLDGEPPLSEQQLRSMAQQPGQELTFTCAPWGSGRRMAIDRDLDGVGNASEVSQGSRADNPQSSQFDPLAGLWYNPERSGHGIDLQRSGDQLIATWYTYEDDGQPTWYQASGNAGENFSGQLFRFQWNPETGAPEGEVVGLANLTFSDRASARFEWQIGDRSGSEPFQRFLFSSDLTLRPYTGVWFDADEPGWGLSIDALGDTRVVVAYFYDDANQPRWAIGQGDNQPNRSTEMLSFTGFCPDCDFQTTNSVAGGSVSLDFADLRHATTDLELPYPGMAGGRWLRVATIQPLSNPANLP
jgi:DNA-binding beta-propeller fold protein YncE